jgi:hypothetical protein
VLSLVAWALSACVLTLVNRFFGFAVPLERMAPPIGHAVALVYLATLLFALMQAARSAARLPASAPTLLAAGLAFAAPMGVLLLLNAQRLPAPPWLLLTANNLFLPIGACLFGAAVGRVIRHPNTLLAAAGFSIFFDIVMVTMGTVAVVMQRNPGIIAAVSVGAGGTSVPTARSVAPITGVTIGPADVLFLAIFFSSVYLLRLSWRATFAWMYGLLLLALAQVELIGLPVPALAPMGIAVLIANLRHQQFTADEKRYLVIGGAFAVFCAGAIVLISSRTIRHAPPEPQRLGLQIARNPQTGVFAVMGVSPGSRAEEAGLEPGNAVLEIDGRKPDTIPPAEYAELLQNAGTRGLRLKVKAYQRPPREVTFEPVTSPSPAASGTPPPAAAGG